MFLKIDIGMCLSIENETVTSKVVDDENIADRALTILNTLKSFEILKFDVAMLNSLTKSQILK
jgi:hypothetical protein